VNSNRFHILRDSKKYARRRRLSFLNRLIGRLECKQDMMKNGLMKYGKQEINRRVVESEAKGEIYSIIMFKQKLK